MLSLYNDGMAAFNQGQYARAEQLFRQALGYAGPFNSGPCRMIGRCLEEQGKDQEALRAYNSACLRDPLDLEALRLRDALRSRLENAAGEELADRDQWRDALNRFRKAVSLDRGNLVARDNLAQADRHVRHDDAAARIQRILNGLVVEVEAPAPPAAVKFTPPADSMFQKGSRESAPVDVRSWRPGTATRPAPATAAQPAPSAPRAPLAPPGRGEPKRPETRPGTSDQVLYVYYGVVTRHRYRGAWPGPINPEPRLPNPYDDGQIARENALARPLDRERFIRLDTITALAVLSDRYYAGLNRATRATAGDLEAELAKARQAGQVPPGENLTGLMRKEPKVAAVVDKAVRDVCDREGQRIRQAGEEYKEDLKSYLRARDQRVLFARRVNEVVDRLWEETEEAVYRLERQTQQEVDEAYRPLQAEGLWAEGENPRVKAIGDIALQNRLYDVERPIRERQGQKNRKLYAAFHDKVRQSVEQIRKELGQ